ncbi:MAG: hypothetical protein JSU82_02285 [Rhodospirillales bacterium]|nr:MAG: hypothetical protein JSU82_02285 [Rhodospirillales bacterium]
MPKLFAVLVVIAGIVGFATVGQAACGHDLDVADTGSATVATDTVTKPVTTEQTGG